MEITLTIKADASQELSEMFKALGIALQGELKPQTPITTAETVGNPTTVAKKPRPRANKTETPTEVAAPVEENVVEDEPVTLESLRMQVVALAKTGKSAAIKAVFKEFGAERLQDVKKEDYKAVAAQLRGL